MTSAKITPNPVTGDVLREQGDGTSGRTEFSSTENYALLQVEISLTEPWFDFYIRKLKGLCDENPKFDQEIRKRFPQLRVPEAE
jgi:hypothetical protein